MSSESLYFVEQTDFVLRFARCSPQDRPLRINRLAEVLAGDPAAAAEVAQRTFTTPGSPLVCALRPRGARVIASTQLETQPPPSVEAYVRGLPQPGALGWLAAVDPASGGAPKPAGWLLTGSSGAAFAEARTLVSGFECQPTRLTSGLLATAGALMTDIAGPTLLLELGEQQSHALLVDRSGVLGGLPIDINRDRIAEAVQAELGQKTREAAALLFFSREHDFKDRGPAIAERLAAAIMPDLTRLLEKLPAPVALYSASLASSQQWLIAHLAERFDLPVHRPDYRAWCERTGVTFGSSVAEASLSPAWLGLVHAIQAQAMAGATSPAWLPEWYAPDPEAAAPARSAPAAAPAKSVSAVRIQPVEDEPARRPKSKGGLILAAAGGVVVLGLGIMFLQSQQSESAQRRKAEELIQAEQARLKQAEEAAARAAPNTREKTAAEQAQKRAYAEFARAQAEKEARAQAEARKAKARGSVLIATEPAGASVTLDDLPARPSPATFDNLKLGTHRVRVSLAQHEDATFEVEVKENETTKPAKLKLQKALGGLEISSTPDGVAYELRPASATVADAALRRTGQTPAKLDGLPPGEYTVTFSRPGWERYKQTVTIARGSTARARWAVPLGHLEIASDPAGATVKRAGQVIGTTPFTLKDQPPSSVALEFVREEYDQPIRLTGTIEAGKTTEVAARFAPEDRVYRQGEYDAKPQPPAEKPIKLPYYLAIEKPKIEVEFTVSRDGIPSNFRVLHSTNRDVDRYCINAIGTWKYKPATLRGRPVAARVSLVMTNFAAAE